MRAATAFPTARSTASAGTRSSVFANLERYFRTWRTRRKLVKMTDLDDHMLDDIGVSRSDIHAVLELPFSHSPALELQRIAQRNRANWLRR
jgi:uncharacterized protein YjiS (DUF1127 family)